MRQQSHWMCEREILQLSEWDGWDQWDECLTAGLSRGCVLASRSMRVSAIDFAKSRYAQMWLRHPVYGDPSFDAFERVSGNPIHRGSPPFDWPVNGFLFHDPVSANDYIYVGDYGRDYMPQVSRCILYRSTDGMKSWSNLGVVLEGDPDRFDKGGHTPDASVVYDGGRYHMVYDWGTANFNEEGGLAYAWAERPEGPWHRALAPITRNSTLPKMLGRYQRTYAPTLVRRKHDWLLVAMMDAATHPNTWALCVMTAQSIDGPWSERRLIRHVLGDDFHPPLMEFYPAFTRDGFVYAPACSVALNRNFNVLFRAPLERADDPAAWEIAQYGSLWHSENVENEYYGMWGQTFSGSIDGRGTLWAMFNSRDAGGFGTVNLARRPWDQPMRRRGFVFTGNQGPGFTCLRRTFRDFDLEASFRLNGTALLIWDWHGALGPDLPQADATLHPLVKTRFHAVELSLAGWAIVSADESGKMDRLASGLAPDQEFWKPKLSRRANGEVRLSANGQELWVGNVESATAETHPGGIGFWVEPHTHLAVEKFEITGQPLPVRITCLAHEALLGAGETFERWKEVHSAEFRFGTGLISRQTNAQLKWNVTGRRLTLWSPRGPEFGKVRVLLDGKPVAEVNLHAGHVMESQPIWTSDKLHGRFHALVCQSVDGSLPVDCLEVEG